MTQEFINDIHKTVFTNDEGIGCTVTTYELMGNRWVQLTSEKWANVSEALDEYGYSRYYDLSDDNGMLAVRIITDFDALKDAPQTAFIQGVEGEGGRGLFYFEMTETLSAFDIECGSNLEAFLFEHSDCGYSESVTEITPEIVDIINGDRPWWERLDADELATLL